jgi:hypothetical protein
MSWRRAIALINLGVVGMCLYSMIQQANLVPMWFGYPVGLLLADSMERLLFK